MNLKVGSIVTLQSGGPDMTVMAVNGNEVTTRWYFEKEGFRVDTFDVATLKAKDEKGGKVSKAA